MKNALLLLAVLIPLNSLAFNAKFVTASGNMSCLATASKLKCVGEVATDKPDFKKLEKSGFKNIRLVQGFWSHVCVVDDRGLWCSSKNLDRPDLKNITWLSGNWTHLCAVHSKGADCWGGADNNFDKKTIPAGFNNITQIQAGGQFTCLLDSKRGHHCWGIPEVVSLMPRMTKVESIHVGGHGACAVHSRGLSCWGMHGFTQGVPATLPAPKQLGLGNTHFCLSDKKNKLDCLGGVTPNLRLPSGMGEITAISSGFVHSCALSKTKGAVCWRKLKKSPDFDPFFKHGQLELPRDI